MDIFGGAIILFTTLWVRNSGVAGLDGSWVSHKALVHLLQRSFTQVVTSCCCCQEASVPLQVGLSIGLLECHHDRAAGFSQSKRSER